MKKLFKLTVVIILLASCNHLHAQTTTAATEKTASKTASKTEQEINKISREMIDALFRGDKKVWEHYLADNYMETAYPYGDVTTKAQALENFQALPANHSLDFVDIQVKEAGNTAVKISKVKHSINISNQTITRFERVTEVFMKQDGEWKIIAFHLSVIPGDKTPAKIDPAVYDAYVGQYDIGDGHIVTLTRQGDKLISQMTGTKESFELLPENETTFFIKGQPSEVISFVKDEKGQVSHSLYHLPDGQKIKQKKMK